MRRQIPAICHIADTAYSDALCGVRSERVDRFIMTADVKIISNIRKPCVACIEKFLEGRK